MNVTDFDIFKSIPTLKTERLKLRKIDKNDLSDIFEYSSDPEVSKYLLWSAHENIKVTKTYLNAVIKKYKCGQFYDWGIEFEGKMIGTCGFSRIDALNDTAEAGYVLARPFWGMGLAKEALCEVLSFGFSVLKLKRIECICLEENKRSLAVMRKCGMNISTLKKSAINHRGIMKNIYVSYILNPNL